MVVFYWEGICAVEGIMNSETMVGTAYVELTGYESMGSSRYVICINQALENENNGLSNRSKKRK